MRDIESARLAYVRFKKLPVGHVFIIFRYANGEEIAISPEAKLADGEAFSLLRGFFKTYRLRYSIREPKAFIRQYREHGRHVIECPLELTYEELVLLERRMRERAAQLDEQFEWYHTLFNSCVTSVLDRLDEVVGRKRRLPGVLLIFAPTRLSRLHRSPNRSPGPRDATREPLRRELDPSAPQE